MREEELIEDDFFEALGVDGAAEKPSRPSRRRGEKAEADAFAKVKVKLVMRVFGVSRSRAMQIVEARAKVA